MWFSYMMLFFQAVLNMRAAVAGAMLLLGNVADNFYLRLLSKRPCKTENGDGKHRELLIRF